MPQDIFDTLTEEPPKDIFDSITLEPEGPPNLAPMLASGPSVVEPQATDIPNLGAGAMRPLRSEGEITPTAIQRGMGLLPPVQLEHAVRPFLPESVQKIPRGLEAGTAELLSGLTSEESLASMPAYFIPAVQEALMLYQGGKSTYEGTKGFIEALKSGDVEGAAKIIPQIGAGLFMLIGGARGAKDRIQPSDKLEIAQSLSLGKESPEVQAEFNRLWPNRSRGVFKDLGPSFQSTLQEARSNISKGSPTPEAPPTIPVPPIHPTEKKEPELPRQMPPEASPPPLPLTTKEFLKTAAETKKAEAALPAPEPAPAIEPIPPTTPAEAQKGVEKAIEPQPGTPIDVSPGLTLPTQVQSSALKSVDLGSGVTAKIDAETGQIRYQDTKGNYVGRLETSETPDGILLVENHTLEDDARGLGLGGKGIKELSDATGKIIASDQYPSKAAQSMWERIGAKRENVKLSDEETQTRYVYRPAPTPPVIIPPIEQGAGMIGMGGALTGEVDTGAGADIYGIAQRIREQRAKAGQTVQIDPNQGVSDVEAVIHGQNVLEKNPLAAQQAVDAFAQTKAFSYDGIAATRAQGEKAFADARKIEQEKGTNSPEYKAAFDEAVKWDKASKLMQTEWHKAGRAQQGQTDLDTGSFTGLQRAFQESTDRDFSPEQKPKAEKIAKGVKAATDESAGAKRKLNDALNQERPSPEENTPAQMEERAQRLLDSVKPESPDIDAVEANLKSLQVERTPAEQKAFDAAAKTVRESAARAAQAETKIREADATRDTDVAKIQKSAEEKAAKAASKTVREAAAIEARAETAKRIVQADREKAFAEKDRADALVKQKKAWADIRNRAAEAAKKARIEAANPERAVWRTAQGYLDKGVDNFDTIRNKVATDLGLSVKKVTDLLAYSPRLKYLADEVWRKQQNARRLKEQAKRWITDQSMPFVERQLSKIPKVFFTAKVFGHGTVALGTHAPMVAFQPKFWKSYIQDFGKMYKLVGKPTPKGQEVARAFYEREVQDLMRRPNYITARRAGLVNDPFQYEDFNSPDTSKWIGSMSSMGNRGYAILKILRQDMFDQMWNKLPKTTQIPEMAEAIADGLNHATGVVKGKAPPGTHVALFAPRLAGSRVMWLAGDPWRAIKTRLDWKNASPAEKMFAEQQLREKAWVAGTFLGMLAVNQGFLAAIGSDQKINGIPEFLGGGGFDPIESDFMKFKVAGHDIAYGSAMLNMAKLPLRVATSLIWHGKGSKLVKEDERFYNIIGEYVRTQLSPFAGTAADLFFGRDYADRPLPRKGFGLIPGEHDIPKRLQQHGITQPYTWPEYILPQVAPIPVAEGIKEVWRKGFGMTDEQIAQAMKAIAVISVMAGTGSRVTEDYKVAK